MEYNYLFVEMHYETVYIQAHDDYLLKFSVICIPVGSSYSSA